MKKKVTHCINVVHHPSQLIRLLLFSMKTQNLLNLRRLSATYFNTSGCLVFLGTGSRYSQLRSISHHYTCVLKGSKELLLALEHSSWSQNQKPLVPAQGFFCSVSEAVENNRRTQSRRSWESPIKTQASELTDDLDDDGIVIKKVEVLFDCNTAGNAPSNQVVLMNTHWT